jgi:DNA replication initiation complex subunit (GINS family)
MFGLYNHAIVDHAPFIYRLVCLTSINAELFEHFFDKIADITRKTWNKHVEQLIPNAFLHVQAENAQEDENEMMVSQERELSKLAKKTSTAKEHSVQ